eukprot:NODE_3509_length_965_cov_24.715066_g3222_i0.p1 GENE.NODE_3509_length_965_cov_24.715066_g3222_i0~~NODE_3509_length_965_cov_24.715066_g3222_i0.p1  ORF type:complete len:150 (+),score=28.19 NODE_3509_length_965_cov_24.715066_g3222_i0:429-878(+)
MWWTDMLANVATWFVSTEQRVFSIRELSRYDGTDVSGPIYLSILGEVYDVSAGRKNYGPGAEHHALAGRDASAAFITGDLSPSGLISDISQLQDHERYQLLDWRDFYARHRKYRFVGVLRDRFYDWRGRPTGETEYLRELIRLKTGFNV